MDQVKTRWIRYSLHTEQTEVVESYRPGFDFRSALNTLIPAPVGGEAGEAEDAHCRHLQMDLKPPDAKGAESTAASPNTAVADETEAGRCL